MLVPAAAWLAAFAVTIRWQKKPVWPAGRLSHSIKGAPLRPLKSCVHPSDHAFIAIEMLLPGAARPFYKNSIQLMYEAYINTIKPLLITTV
jgi:hypothetical protein